MTVNVTKPALNIREKLAELDKPSGIAGEAMLRADSVQEQRNLIGAGRKNLIINGGFDVWQRGTSLSPNLGYSADRWKQNDVDSPITQNIPTLSVKETGRMLIKSVGTNTGRIMRAQGVELKQSDIGKTMTFSFKISKAAAAVFGSSAYIQLGIKADSMVIRDGTKTTITTVSEVSTSSSAPTSLSISFVVPTFTNYLGVGFVIDLLTNTQATTELFRVQDIQLELGSVATDFEHRSYGEELALCQRYFFASENQFQYVADEGGVKHYNFPSEMRSAPTVTMSSAPSGMTINRTRKHFATFNGATVNGDVTFTADAEL